MSVHVLAACISLQTKHDCMYYSLFTAMRTAQSGFCNLPENTLDLKIRTGADPRSVRTRYGKSHVGSMQFSVCGKFPDSRKKTLLDSNES